MQLVYDLLQIKKSLNPERKVMQVSDYEQLKLLHQRYLEEARRFTEALQVNAPQKELLMIRRNVRALLQEIRSFIRSAGSSENSAQV